MSGKIKIAIAGVGNCASSLLQGINYYRNKNSRDAIGLMHWQIGDYSPADIEVVAAFDIDRRKVGKDVHRAIFERPNCTKVFCSNIAPAGVIVKMGQVRDGYSQHLKEYPEEDVFVVSDNKELSDKEIVDTLKESKADMLLNYLPVGSEDASKFYAQCALDAGVAFINNIPVFIASDPQWSKKFEEKNIPVIGDDIKAQIGATITHRVLTDLFKKRGARLDRTYQLNSAGNTDFLNMLNRNRLMSKKESKTEAVQSVTAQRLNSRDIHIGPSDYIRWLEDNKICFIRMEGRLFGDVAMNIELRLSVEDSPNSAGVAIDSIRCCKLALERGIGGVLYSPSAYFSKHPPRQFTDEEGYRMTEEFIGGKRER